MLVLRGLIFILLVPCVIAVYVPQQILGFRVPQQGWWQAGRLLIILGGTI